MASSGSVVCAARRGQALPGDGAGGRGERRLGRPRHLPGGVRPRGEGGGRVGAGIRGATQRGTGAGRGLGLGGEDVAACGVSKGSFCVSLIGQSTLGSSARPKVGE
jgi:hypothetical protein